MTTMAKKYEIANDDLMQLLDEPEKWEGLHNSLNKSLPDTGYEIDYATRLKAMKQFHEDNKHLFLAMMNDG